MSSAPISQNVLSDHWVDEAGKRGVAVSPADDGQGATWVCPRLGAYGRISHPQGSDDWQLEAAFREGSEFDAFAAVSRGEPDASQKQTLLLLLAMLESRQIEATQQEILRDRMRLDEGFPAEGNGQGEFAPDVLYPWVASLRLRHDANPLRKLLPHVSLHRTTGGTAAMVIYGLWERHHYTFRIRNAMATLSVGGDPVRTPRWSASASYTTPGGRPLTTQDFQYLFCLLGSVLRPSERPQLFTFGLRGFVGYQSTFQLTALTPEAAWQQARFDAAVRGVDAGKVRLISKEEHFDVAEPPSVPEFDFLKPSDVTPEDGPFIEERWSSTPSLSRIGGWWHEQPI